MPITEADPATFRITPASAFESWPLPFRHGPRRLSVAALTVRGTGGTFLLSRRPLQGPHGGLWEFPGGKIRPGETPRHAIFRECREELGTTPLFPVPILFLAHRRTQFYMCLFLVTGFSRPPRPEPGRELCRRRPDDIASIPLPPADAAACAYLSSPAGRQATLTPRAKRAKSFCAYPRPERNLIHARSGPSSFRYSK